MSNTNNEASWTIRAAAVLTLILPAGSAGHCTASERAATLVSIPNPGLENDGHGWSVELGHGRLNRLQWLTEGAREGTTCAKLTYSGKEWLWLNTPPLGDLPPNKEVTLVFHAKWLSGGNVFSVGCNSRNRADNSWGAAHDNLWVGELPKDNKWHELEIRFTTPDFDFKNQCLCIKMGPRLEAAAVLVDHVRILSAAEARPDVQEPFDASRVGQVRFDLPDELVLGDFREVSQKTIDGKPWREIRLGDICLRAPAKVEVKMGFHEIIPLVAENKDAAKATVEVIPAERMNVYTGKESAEVPGGGKVAIPVDVQTLRAAGFDLVLTVRCGGLEKSLPVRIEPQATYPVFGLVEHFMRSPPRSRGSFLDPKTNAKAEEDMKYLRLLPCQVFRVDGPGCWSVVERSKGEHFFDAADWHLAATKKFGGSKAVMLLGYQPAWTNAFFDVKEEEKLLHWREYVRAIVRRYHNQVDYWEIWNEPYGFWFGGWGQHRRKLYQEDYAEECSPILAAVIKTASEVIRQEDPDGKILTPGFIPPAKEPGSDAYRMMEKLFALGMGDWVDFVNLHIYPGLGRAIPTTPTQPYKVDGKEVVSWEAPLRRWRKFDEDTTMQGLVELMEKHDVRKPLWITEFGGHPAAHERSQGLGILRQAAILVAEGAKGLHYYEFYDYPHEPSRYQLVRHEDKYRTLGLVAYSQAIRYLTGASYEPDRCEVRSPGDSAADNLPYRVFGRGDQTIICLWSNAATPAEVQIRTREKCGAVHVASFCPQGAFFTEASLSPGGKTCDGTTRVVADRQLTTVLRPLEFRILSIE